MSIKEIVTGAVVTLVIGGSAYTVNQADVASNLAEDTGMSQQQAEEYVNSIDQEELVSYDELGAGHIKEGQSAVDYAAEIDCVNYEYEWESASLSCDQGKTQLDSTGRDEIALGEAFRILSKDSATEADIATTIRLIDKLNADYDLPIISGVYDAADMDEVRKTNSYNKALLKAALDSTEE